MSLHARLNHAFKYASQQETQMGMIIASHIHQVGGEAQFSDKQMADFCMMDEHEFRIIWHSSLKRYFLIQEGVIKHHVLSGFDVVD